MDYDFPYIRNSNPNWLIFFRGVETTNQLLLMVLVGNVIIFLLAGAPYDK